MEDVLPPFDLSSRWNPTQSVKQIGRHGATMIRCRRLGPRNQTLKAVLYSAASVIEARQYLCLDADTLVLEELGPLFECLEALPPQSVLVAKDAFLRAGPLGDQPHVITRAGTTTFLGSSAPWRMKPIIR